MDPPNENVKLTKVSLFIRERPHSTSSSHHHLLPTSPLSVTHPKSYPPQDQCKKHVHSHHRDGKQRAEQPITTIFDEYKRIKINNPKTFQSPRQEQKQFAFDKIFPHNATQSTMFDEVGKPIVNHTLNGYNACCFAYGQTGSGKTYTIFGEHGLRRGIVHRSIDYLFQHLRIADSSQSTKASKLKKSALQRFADKQSKSLHHKHITSTKSGSTKSKFNQLSVNCHPETGDDDDNNDFSVIPTFFHIIKDKGVDPEFASPDDKYCVVISFLEIYLDRIRDLGMSYLLQKGYRPKPNSTTTSIPPMNSPRNYTAHPFDHLEKMEIREDINGQVYVKGLHHIPVKSAKEAMFVIQSGLRKRKQGSTKMNDVSSRSHSIVSVSILQKSYSFTQDIENGLNLNNTGNGPNSNNSISDNFGVNGISNGMNPNNGSSSDTDTWSFDINDTDSYLPYGYQLYGRMHFIDLAGSERLDRSGSKGLRMLEAVNINQSLTALGKVVISLSNPDKHSHVPFRDSKLTRILQNSLCGNCKTTVLATINPYKSNYEETLMTLEFAHRCTHISTKIHTNYLDHRDRMTKLQKRIQLLLRELASLKEGYALNSETIISPKSIRKFLLNKQPELAQDLGNLVEATTSLLTTENNTSTQRQSVSFKSDTSSQHYKHLMNQMNASFANKANANNGGMVNAAFSSFDFGKLRDLEDENEELQRSNRNLHERLNEQNETANAQIVAFRKRISDLESKLEVKDQDSKHIESTLKEAMETQSKNLLAANRKSIESVLITLLKTPSYSLRGTIRKLLNEHKCSDHLNVMNNKDIGTMRDHTDSKSEDLNDFWTMTNENEVVPSGHSHIPRKRFDAFCGKMEGEKKEEIKSLKRKFEETLNYKQTRIGTLKKEMESMHREHEEQHKQLQREFKFLYKCLGNLTGIIESVENGHFTVHITSGIKKIEVPKSEDTESTQSTLKRCDTLRHLLHRSDSFIDQQIRSDANLSDDDGQFECDHDERISNIVIHNELNEDFDKFGIEDIAEEISEVDSINNIDIIDRDSLRDDSPAIMSPLHSERRNPQQFYQKQATETRKALNSLKIAFESQKRQIGNQDERIRNLMISRSSSLSKTFHQSRSFRKLPTSHRDKIDNSVSARTHRTLTRSASQSRPRSAVSRRNTRPNSAKMSLSSFRSNDISQRRRSRPSSAHRPCSAKSEVIRLPFNKISNNRIFTRFQR